ncbi:amidohydrolase family protein [Spirillospora sp. NPDC048911]|uniref:amidohydrolase family protein n=1 Tax=Spirillospora sp. NPDC048911 TaxID=3364527 RepID=UPI0037101F6E
MDLGGHLNLVDHHCHGIQRAPLGPSAFGQLLTESDAPPPAGVSFWDSSLGFAVRRWCAPVLSLDSGVDAQTYLEQRLALGRDADRLFLAQGGLSALCIDDGFPADEVLTVPEMAELSGRRAFRIVRLEAVAEEVAKRGVSAEEFADAFAHELATQCGDQAVVGLKSVIGYRHGLDFEAESPSPAAVKSCAESWLQAAEPESVPQLKDPVLLRHVLYTGARLGGEMGLPLQFHTGLGDTSLHLGRVDPLHLTDFIRQVQDCGTTVVLLHGYPFHRNASYLAHAYPHVYTDVGLSLNYVGRWAHKILSEVLELAPFAKVLFSTDAYGLADLYYLGTVLFRRAMQSCCEQAVASGDWADEDARRVAQMVGSENALRIYRRLPPLGS